MSGPPELQNGRAIAQTQGTGTYIISTAQQARPTVGVGATGRQRFVARRAGRRELRKRKANSQVIGHIEPCRAQLTILSRPVRTYSTCSGVVGSAR